MTADETTQDKAILMKCEVKEKGSENKHKFQSPSLDLFFFQLIQGHHKYSLQEQSDRTFLWSK